MSEVRDGEHRKNGYTRTTNMIVKKQKDIMTERKRKKEIIMDQGSTEEVIKTIRRVNKIMKNGVSQTMKLDIVLIITVQEDKSTVMMK